MVGLARRRFVLGSLAFAASAGGGPAGTSPLRFRVADIGHGIRLHYVEQGEGPPLIFVHGSLSDYTYWKEQFPFFARDYRVIAYSRRYNWPNRNPAQRGYSAIADADDLADFIERLHLQQPVIIGHSYGALAAVFLAIRHPGALRALVLAEPPAISLLNDFAGPDAAKGRAMFVDIQSRMVEPMRAAFAKHEREKGVAIFIDYVFGDPHAWDRFSPDDRAQSMKDAHEWDVMMTTGTLFPDLPPQALREITIPVLMFSGERSYPFLRLISTAVARLLPRAQSDVIPATGHQMWLQKGDHCRQLTREFLRRVETAARAATDHQRRQ